MRLSAPRTRWPRRTNSSVRWDPMKPAPPVTRYVGIVPRTGAKADPWTAGNVVRTRSVTRGEVSTHFAMSAHVGKEGPQRRQESDQRRGVERRRLQRRHEPIDSQSAEIDI